MAYGVSPAVPPSFSHSFVIPASAGMTINDGC